MILFLQKLTNDLFPENLKKSGVLGSEEKTARINKKKPFLWVF